MEGSQDLLQRIRDEYAKMSKGQKRIADYILYDYDKAAFVTASKMGQTVGVSESTVVRFAYAMGYDGYPELQKSLQELIRSKLTSVQRIALSADVQEHEVLKSVLKADINNIRATLDSIDQTVFQQAVDRLVAADEVFVIGTRSSTPLAQFLAYYLNFVMEHVHQVSSGTMNVLEQMVDIHQGDVAIGISFPRYSKSALEAMQYAKQKGAFTIALTDSSLSPVASYADICLTARSNMASFADSLVAPLSLINAIIFAVGQHNTEKTTERIKRLEGIWNHQRVYIGDKTDQENQSL